MAHGQRLAIISIIILLALAAAAVFVWSRREALMVSLFGPPSATLSEAYEEKPDGPTFDHSLFDELLAEHVDGDGWVDYAGFRSAEPKLDEYIERIGKAPFEEMGRSEKLALLINAYNAFTLKLILERYPLESIQDISAADRWNDIRWKVGRYTWSLAQIEHEQIRPKFREPRIHFALVCAAVGCPPLRNEAYTAKKLDRQLESQAQYVHRHRTWFQFESDRRTVGLTRLYSWYGSDFRQLEPTVLHYAARYSTELGQALGEGATPDIDWLPYDWRLNEVKNREPR